MVVVLQKTYADAEDDDAEQSRFVASRKDREGEDSSCGDRANARS